VFVTGLSAGGAMATAMLATHPELFAGGAIIGGLPFACAAGVPQALERMRGHGLPDADAGAAAVRRAAPAPAQRPAVSLWHGGADATVVPAAMTAHGRQWRAVMGLPDAPSSTERGAGWERRRWLEADGRVALEEWTIPAMGHGVPIDPDGPGAAGPFFLDTGVDSTALIAAGWGIAPTVPMPTRAAAPAPAATGVTETIGRALREAGLMR
jgi:poly(3-hydroxybutyrate) depolymerase